MSAPAKSLAGGGRFAAIPSAEVIRQNSNLDPARAALANQLVGLKTQRDALITQQQVLAQSEQQLREAYTRLPNKQLERDRLAQQVALKRALYDQVQAKRIDAQAAEAETVSSLSVASPPATQVVPVEAMSPILVLLLGGIVGLGLGGGLVFLLDMLDPTIRIFEDLDKLFEDQDIPLLGLVPEVHPRQGEPVLIIDANHPCNDIYERLRSNLQISGAEINNGRVPKTVLITSAIAQEGKTTTAYNLGIASARAGRRTLIVEMDLRNPSQAWRLDVQPDADSVTEPLQYYSGRLSDPIRMVPTVANLYITPSVGPQRNPTAIFDASEMRRFLQDIQSRFDFVIFDAPHFTGSNDAMLLEPRTDGMVIVARPRRDPKADYQSHAGAARREGRHPLVGSSHQRRGYPHCGGSIARQHPHHGRGIIRQRDYSGFAQTCSRPHACRVLDDGSCRLGDRLVMPEDPHPIDQHHV